MDIAGYVSKTERYMTKKINNKFNFRHVEDMITYVKERYT
jgi:hypothetical protein